MTNQKLMHPLLLAFLLLCSCSGSRKLMDGERRQLSHHERPAWADAPERAERPGSDMYSGYAPSFSTESAAREAAHCNARRQAVASIGQEVEKLVDRVIGPADENNGLLTPALVWNGLARLDAEGIEGEEVLKWHIERWESQENGASRRTFTAFCLLEVPGNGARRFLMELLETRARDSDDPSVHVLVGEALKELETNPVRD